MKINFAIIASILLVASCGGSNSGSASNQQTVPSNTVVPASPDGPVEVNDVPGEPDLACSWSIPSEGPAQGDYAYSSYLTQRSIGDVAISNRGWRTVAGGQDGNIYVFGRGETNPRLIFEAGDQVNAVAIARDGRAFAAAASGKIYLFECDATLPTWVYDTSQDITSGTPVVDGVSMSADGRYVAAASRSHTYLFRRDRATPILKALLSNKDSLSSIALSADGLHIVAGTRPEEDSSRVFLLDRVSVKWAVAISDLGWGPNDMPTPVAISADGSVVAAGGRDNQIHRFSTSSSPDWVYKIADESPVFSVALSDDGTKLLATGDFKLFFFDGVQTPTFVYAGSYGGPGMATDPIIYPGSGGELGEYGVGNYIYASAISSDGNFFVAGDWVYGHAFTFHKSFNVPYRMYDFQDDYDATAAVSISPDGSWIVMGSSFYGEVARFELAPFERIIAANHLTYSIKDENASGLAELIGGDKFKIDYFIAKPGRAAHLKENWDLWTSSGGAIFPPVKYLCSGDNSWTYDHNMSDGFQEESGRREIDPPQCLSSQISSVDFFLLKSNLKDEPSDKDLFYDSVILANVQVGTGMD